MPSFDTALLAAEILSRLTSDSFFCNPMILNSAVSFPSVAASAFLNGQ